MLNDIAIILATAALSSALTLTGIYWWYRRHFETTVLPQLEERLRTQLDEALAELGEVVETRTRQGVLSAVAAIPSTETLAGTTRTVAKTGAELLGKSLSTLLGGRPAPPSEDEPD